MSIAEYYYPLTTLHVKTQSDKKYFDASINTVINPKINFAITESDNAKTIGSASEYYIQTVNAETEKTKIGNATKYLVIKHRVTGTCSTGTTCSANCEKITEGSPCTPKPFYVAFPLYIAGEGEDISSYIKLDRMNGRLAQSINNLQDATKSVQFSLESVINSMKSFAPTGYYKLTDLVTQKKIYVLNKPIYIKNIDTSSFYERDIAIPSNLGITIPSDLGITIPSDLGNLTTASIKQVVVKRTCLKPISSKKPTYKTLFYGLSKYDQTRIDYLNLIYGLSTLIFIIIFYYIYTNYMQREWKSLLYGMIVALALVVIPIGITKSVYESKTGKVNVKDLQHSIIFARFFTLGFMSSILIIFGWSNIRFFIITHFGNSLWWDEIFKSFLSLFKDWTKEKGVNILILFFSLILISWSIYIFIPDGRIL